jgi:hypothetical protein
MKHFRKSKKRRGHKSDPNQYKVRDGGRHKFRKCGSGNHQKELWNDIDTIEIPKKVSSRHHKGRAEKDKTLSIYHQDSEARTHPIAHINDKDIPDQEKVYSQKENFDVGFGQEI